MEPRLLLLDEAMAGLRGVEVDLAMDLIRAVSRRGITLLIIEHVMKVITGVCNRVGGARLRQEDRRRHARRSHHPTPRSSRRMAYLGPTATHSRSPRRAVPLSHCC